MQPAAPAPPPAPAPAPAAPRPPAAAPAAPQPSWVAAAGQWMAAASPQPAGGSVLLAGEQRSWEGPLRDGISKALGLPVALVTGVGQQLPAGSVPIQMFAEAGGVRLSAAALDSAVSRWAGRAGSGHGRWPSRSSEQNLRDQFVLAVNSRGQAGASAHAPLPAVVGLPVAVNPCGAHPTAPPPAACRVAPGNDVLLALQGAWLRAGEAAAAAGEGPAAQCLQLLQGRVVRKVVGVLEQDEDDLFFEGGRQRKALLNALVSGRGGGGSVCG